jgi:lysozyme
MTRPINDAGMALIEQFEGCRLDAYQDQNGVWTIGRGHTRGVKAGDICTQEQADQWFAQDCAMKSAAVDTSTFDVPTTDNQYAALCSLCFNIGTGNFAQSTALKLHRAQEYQPAATAFLMWCEITVDGVRQKDAGLVARRQAERALYLTP